MQKLNKFTYCMVVVRWVAEFWTELEPIKLVAILEKIAWPFKKWVYKNIRRGKRFWLRGLIEKGSWLQKSINEWMENDIQVSLLSAMSWSGERKTRQRWGWIRKWRGKLTMEKKLNVESALWHFEQQGASTKDILLLCVYEMKQHDRVFCEKQMSFAIFFFYKSETKTFSVFVTYFY